jgi:hypothetical protein
MQLFIDGEPAAIRIVTMRLDMSTARYQGLYNVHHFMGIPGFSQKILRLHNNCVYMYEYANSTSVGGDLYSNLPFDGTGQPIAVEERIKGTLWGISQFRFVPDVQVGHSVDRNIVQTFKRERTWYFPTPVRIRKAKSERGRWLSMKDHRSEQALLVDQTSLATGGRAILSFESTVEQFGDIPGMFVYSKDPCDNVEHLGPLPGIWGSSTYSQCS